MAYYTVAGEEKKEMLAYCDYGNGTTFEQARSYINNIVRYRLSTRQLVMKEDL